MCVRKASCQIPYWLVKINKNLNRIGMQKKNQKEFLINRGICVLSSNVLRYIFWNVFFDVFRNKNTNIKNLCSFTAIRLAWENQMILKKLESCNV